MIHRLHERRVAGALLRLRYKVAPDDGSAAAGSSSHGEVLSMTRSLLFMAGPRAIDAIGSPHGSSSRSMCRGVTVGWTMLGSHGSTLSNTR